MKKIVFLSGIIITTLVISCSSDDTIINENQKTSKTNLIKDSKSDFCVTCRETDTLRKEGDTIILIEIDPVKPRRD